MTDLGAVTGFYGRWARLYDAVARRTPGVGPLRERAADALALDPGDTVVEMGCGTGANLPYLRERAGPDGRVIGIDLTRGMLERARERGGTLVRGDAATPPVRAADAVLATFVVGMLDDPGAAVDRWCDLLAPGGRLVLVDAASSDRPAARPANPLFRALVLATSPPGTRLRYETSPAAVLDRRVATARSALADRGPLVRDERHVLGFVRLTAGAVE